MLLDNVYAAYTAAADIFVRQRGTSPDRILQTWICAAQYKRPQHRQAPGIGNLGQRHQYGRFTGDRRVCGRDAQVQQCGPVSARVKTFITHICPCTHNCHCSGLSHTRTHNWLQTHTPHFKWTSGEERGSFAAISLLFFCNYANVKAADNHYVVYSSFKPWFWVNRVHNVKQYQHI